MADSDEGDSGEGPEQRKRSSGGSSAPAAKRSVGGDTASAGRRSTGGDVVVAAAEAKKSTGGEDVSAGPPEEGRMSGEEELEEGEVGEEEEGVDTYSSSVLPEGGDEDRGGDDGDTRTRTSRASRAFSKPLFEEDEIPLVRRKSAIWPEVEEKFRPGDVQRLIEKVVKEHLEGPVPPEDMNSTIKSIVEAIQARVKALKYPRYRIVTACVLGERKGEGVSSVTRCLWDPLADCLATYSYINDTVFCTAVVYGIYYY